MAALRARRLVWSAMSLMTLMTPPISSDFLPSRLTAAADSSTSDAMPLISSTVSPTTVAAALGAAPARIGLLARVRGLAGDVGRGLVELLDRGGRVLRLLLLIGEARGHLLVRGGDLGGGGRDLAADARDVGDDRVDVLDEGVEPVGEAADLVAPVEVDALGQVAVAGGDVLHGVDEVLERVAEHALQEEDEPAADDDARSGR
jgi:hypothetical protein